MKVKDLLKHVSEKFEKKSLTADQAWNICRFQTSKTETLEKIIDVKIKDIEEKIIYRSQEKATSVFIEVPEDEKDVFDRISEHFSKCGFIVADKIFPEINNAEYILISWEKGGKVCRS